MCYSDLLLDEIKVVQPIDMVKKVVQNHFLCNF